MQHRRRHSLLAISLVGALALAACGGDDDDSAGTDVQSTDAATETTAAAADTTEAAAETTEAGSDTTAAAGGGEGSLADVCPETITLLTDWNPEAEHGFVYQLIGEDYTIDKDAVSVSGPLVTSDGTDTGVTFEVRSGGPAIGFQTVTSQLYQDEDILLGYVYTDEAIQNSAEFPTVAIESGFEKNPQMIMWDPATYPDVKTIEDIGEAGILVRYFGGAAYMDYFTQSGILSPDQVDGSYDGTPALFVADQGKSAQQGFGSAEPYIYENEITDWAKPVAYAYINDAGWENYAESIATRPENVTEYADCFKLLVPMIQQASIDYLADPARTNALILDAVETFDNGWVYSQGVADFGVETIKADGLVANGPDDTVGNFDYDRINALIEKAIPVYESLGQSPKEGLTAEDIATNEFIDPSIGF
ncbi:MAG: ABC transporter substrate-binding protein [Acidimicrobiia bacterium]